VYAELDQQKAIDPELEAIITAWPNLPENIKEMIRVLIKTDKNH
jgi:hypothetical protein